MIYPLCQILHVYVSSLVSTNKVKNLLHGQINSRNMWKEWIKNPIPVPLSNHKIKKKRNSGRPKNRWKPFGHIL